MADDIRMKAAASTTRTNSASSISPAPIPDPQTPAPQVAAPAHPHVMHPLCIRAPPQFKSNSTDVDMYLQRFQTYARAVNSELPTSQLQADLLISLLDDKAFSGVSRLVAEGDFDLPELIA